MEKENNAISNSKRDEYVSPHDNAIVIPAGDDRQIADDTFYFKKHIDIYKLINISKIVKTQK